MAITVPELLKMSQAQLDDLFTHSPPGEIPTGEAKGGDRRTGDDLHAGHREFYKSLRVAGESFRSGQRSFTKQDFAPRFECDHREGV
jgi:hypothetical protein